MKTAQQLREEQEKLGNYNPEKRVTEDEDREAQVFIVHDDLRRDFNRALPYGELKAIISGKYDNRYENSAEIVKVIRERLLDFQPSDYLLMVGEPLLAGLVIAMAHERFPDEPLNILRYDKIKYQYLPVQIDFN